MDHEAAVDEIGMSQGEGVPVVLLAARDELVPILVSPDQAHSIALAIRNTAFDRPLTHDLFVEMFTEFGAAIDRVRIDELQDGTFFAKLDAEQYSGGERKQAVFDVRASDGIAISLRVDCSVKISESVLDEAGRNPEEINLSNFESS